MNLRQIIQPANNPKLLYELKPDTHITFTGQYSQLPKTTITISSAGFRDTKHSKIKPDHVYRIAVLGDSVPFGWGVNENERWSFLLQEMLNKNTNNKYEIINFAVPGYNIVQDIETLKTKALSYNPDLILFYLSINDYKLSLNYLYPFNFLESTPAIFFNSYLFRYILSVITTLTDRHLDSKISEGIAAAEKSISSLAEILQKQNIPVIFYAESSPLIPILKKHGFKNNILKISESILNNPNFFYTKDTHPNQKGHKAMAQQLYHRIKSIDNPIH